MGYTLPIGAPHAILKLGSTPILYTSIGVDPVYF